MLNKIFQVLMFFVISFSIVLSPAVKSAELVESGTVLTEDSMVFSIEEADALRVRIESLENTEQKTEALESLVKIQTQEVETLEELLKIKDYQINEWQELSSIHQDRVEKMERREKLNTLENVGWFILGVAVTGGAIYLGDKVGDSMETN